MRVCVCVSQPVPCSTLAACTGNTIDFLFAPHCDTPANSPLIFPILPVRSNKNSHTIAESCSPAEKVVTQEEVERIWMLTMACYCVLYTQQRSDHREPIVVNAGCSDKAKRNDQKLFTDKLTWSQSCFVNTASSNHMLRLYQMVKHVNIVSTGRIFLLT